MTTARFLLVTIVLAVSCGAASAGGIFKWVDDQGRVHYGDRPPGGDKADSVPITETPGADADADASERNARRKRLLDTYAAERKEREVKAAEEDAQRDQIRQRCTATRTRLTEYERANLLYRKGKDGTREYLSDDDRDAMIARLREGIARHCK